MKTSKLLIIFSIFFLCQSVYAQFGSTGVVDARSMSLGKTYNAVSSGVYSLGINPANLLKGNEDIEIVSVLPVPTLSLGAGSNFISLDEINYYFGEVNGRPRYLTEEDKNNLNDIFSEGGILFGTASVNLISIKVSPQKSVGSFAFSINDFVSSRIVFPGELVDIALSGNNLSTSYDFSEAEINAWWIRNYSITYAREIPLDESWILNRINAGISFKLVHGFSYLATQRNITNFTTGSSAELIGKTDLTGYSSFSDNFGVRYKFDPSPKRSDFNLFPSPAGVGFGVDLGISTSLNRWSFALAVTDIGQIKWNKNVAEFFSLGDIFIDDLTNKEQRDSAKKVLELNSREISHIYTKLATTLRFGTAYLFGVNRAEFPGTLLLAFDYNQGLNDLPGNSIKPRFSIGADWKPMDWLPYFRTGFSVGGRIPFGWGFGIGIDTGILEFHFATSDVQGAFAPNSSKAISVSLSSRWKF